MRSQDHDVNLGREYAAESHNGANDDGQAQEHLLNLEFEKEREIYADVTRLWHTHFS